ncbi:MAG: amidohydrolase family protein [Armatimonadetes bacterium]|nr:amidohydrolase family protein [Armatimonadota bacterium]
MAVASESFIVRCGTLLDGTGGRLRDMAVTVAGGRIAAVTPWKEGRRPAGARVVDAGGLTVLPGLFDAHDHLASTPGRTLAEKAAMPPSLFVLRVAEVMREMLQAGFTTVRDMGGLDLGMKMAVEEGLLAGPRVLVSLAIITQTAGLSDYTNAVGFSTDVLRLPGTPAGVCDGVEQVRAMTRRLIRGGADFIKIATTGGISSRISGILTREFTFEEVKAVVDEARAFGKPVAVHAYGGEGLKNALRAGVHSVEHLGPLDDDDIATMVRQGTYLVPTLTNMWTRLELAKVPGVLSPYNIQKAQELAPLQREVFGRACRAGVRIAAGTDSRGLRNGGNARELSLLVQYGMTPMDAIRAATSVAAECCSMPDTGRVEAGQRADLIAVDGDPLRDIETFEETEQIRLVVRDGIVFKDRLG